MKRLVQFAAIVIAASLTSACLEIESEVQQSDYSEIKTLVGADADGVIPANANRSNVRVSFDPENQVIPFPNNLMFEAGAVANSDLDGRLNVPLPEDPNDSTAAVARALNDLDGFSTVESWRLAFTGPIDARTLEIGKTIRVFEMADAGDTYPERINPTAVERELTSDDLAIDYAANTYVVLLQPKKPLKHNRTYSVIFSYGIKDLNGDFVDAPLAAGVAKGTSKLGLNDEGVPTNCTGVKEQITMLQCITNATLAPVLKDERFGLTRDKVMISWGITTQREDLAFVNLANAITSNQIKPGIPNATCKSALCFLDVGSLLGKTAPTSPGGQAVVFPGTIRLPILTQGMKTALDSTDNNYFLGKNKLSRGNSEALISGNWVCQGGTCNSDAKREGNARPDVYGWVTHPVVLSLPKNCPSGGCSLAIFNHAIQQDRTNALAFADTLAKEGIAVVAIDMPLHGLEKTYLDMKVATDASRSQLYAPDLNDQLYNSTLTAARNIIPLMVERTFYMDMVSADESLNDDGSTKADGVIDPSGSHFLNPAMPLAQRDILRQGSIDLVALSHYLRNGNLEQCGMGGFLGLEKTCDKNDIKNKINFNNIHFVGHSVGNIVATPFLGYDKNIRSITMLAPSGVLLRTLEGSPVIGEKLSAGLGAKGVHKGTENYYRFFASVQAVIDAAEPLNHASKLLTRKAANGELEPRPFYAAIIAGSNENSQDKVLPFVIKESPLAGSRTLVNLLGLPTSTDLIADRNSNLATLEDWDNPSLQAALLYNRGDHASFLLPKQDVAAKATKEEGRLVTEDDIFLGADVHFEMQRQVASFIKNNGQRIEHVDLDTIQ